MTKIDVLSCTLLVAIAIMFTFAFHNQMMQEKQKILCNGELRELGSALFIYRQEKQPTKEQEKLWHTILMPFATTNIGFCPSVTTTQPSYKLNENTFSADFEKKRHILFFDATINDETTSSNIAADISKRHLSGANILWSDGSVQYISKTEAVK